MRDDVAALQSLAGRVGTLGADLLTSCAGSIFPCDMLAVTVLERTLNLVKGFSLLVDAGSYTCAAGLLRLQLDSLLRFNGVVTCKDPHDMASRLLAGTSLRNVKHSTGAAMSDKNLQTLLEKRYPWVPRIYALASGYIHLSEQHAHHVMMQAPRDASGTRQFSVSDEDTYMPEDHRSSLVETFSVITQGIFDSVETWVASRRVFGTPEELSARYEAV